MVAVVFTVSDLCIFLKLGGKHACPARFLEADPHSADPREEVDKSECTFFGRFDRRFRQFVFKRFRIPIKIFLFQDVD